MTATAHIGMTSLAQAGVVGVADAKTSAQPQQSFSDSLFAASKAYSENDSVNDGNTKTARRQRSASEDEQTAEVMHRDDAAQSLSLPLQTVQPAQVIPAQQSQTITSDTVLLPLLFAGEVTTACTSGELPAQPAGVDSNIIRSDVDPSRAASIQPGSETQNIEASGTTRFKTDNSAPTVDANATAATSSNAIPSLAQSEVANTVQDVVPSADSSSLPEANPAPVFSAAPSPSASTILASTVGDYSAAKVIPSTAVTDQTLPAIDLGASGETASQSVSPIQSGGGLAGAVPATVSSFNAVSVANQSVTQAAYGKDVSTDTTSDAAELDQLVQAATNQAGSQTYSQQNTPAAGQSQSANSDDAAKLKQLVQAATSHAGLQAYSQQNTPAAGQSQSANSAYAAKLDKLVQEATNQAGSQTYSHQNTPAAGQSQSADSDDAAKLKQLVQAATSHAGLQAYSQQNTPAAGQSQNASFAQMQSGTLPDSNISTIQQGGGWSGTVHATVSVFNAVPVADQSVAHVANGKDQSTDTTNGTAGFNQHAQIATDKAKSQSGSGQDAAVGDQSQNGASSQEQSATPSQTILATNSVAASLPVQNTSTASPAQSASTHAGVTASAAKLPDAASFASRAVTRTSPVINTAKLIQSMGQSEMRVGMRSSEFGNISISTTANKDMISARISLDHGELAKVLAAQLPEMQARLGGNRPMDVRIDMSGAATGQGTGSSGNMSSGTSDQPSSGKQQSAYTASSYSDNSAVERQLFPVAAGTTTAISSLNARLDIRV